MISGVGDLNASLVSSPAQHRVLIGLCYAAVGSHVQAITHQLCKQVPWV